MISHKATVFNSIGKIFRLGFSIFVLTIAGCGHEGFGDLRKFVSEVKARPKGSIQPLPEIKIVEPYIFNPDGMRDPFQPIERIVQPADVQQAIAAGGIRPDVARRREDLESFSLDTLRMVGTLSMKSGLWGLVKVNDGTVHRVQVGNFMGRNHGNIIRIIEDKIELMEIVPDKPGSWREQPASLALAE
jgi:type IV pilus assembly protein PilP